MDATKREMCGTSARTEQQMKNEKRNERLNKEHRRLQLDPNDLDFIRSNDDDCA